MSHQVSESGRPFVECDEGVRTAAGEIVRCRRRSFGRRDRLDPGPELSLFDLPAGWSVAPYPDDYDHGATRTSLLDGSPIPPVAHEVGLRGDLHTCPDCRARMRRLSERTGSVTA